MNASFLVFTFLASSDAIPREKASGKSICSLILLSQLQTNSVVAVVVTPSEFFILLDSGLVALVPFFAVAAAVIAVADAAALVSSSD